jgi:hypothetical protein
MLLVEIKAMGDEIWVRSTGFPPRWLAARPMYVGELICISGCFLRMVKARASDMLAVLFGVCVV